MKRIAAVVRPEKLEPLKEALFQAKISGMTIYQVMVAEISTAGKSTSAAAMSF